MPKIFSNSYILILYKSKAHRTKTMSIKRLDVCVVESYIPGSIVDQGLKGVIYGINIDISEDELLRYLKAAEIRGVLRLSTMQDGGNKRRVPLCKSRSERKSCPGG